MNPVTVKITPLDAAAVIPHYAHDTDAGLDLSSTEDLFLVAGAREFVPTGLAIEIPVGYCGLILPRSGLAIKHGITITNSPGLIDSGYRGEIKVILQNTSYKTYRIVRGERIAQLLILPFPKVIWKEVAALSDSERGIGGFGSSGV